MSELKGALITDLHRQYRDTMLVRGGLLLIAFLVFLWWVWSSETSTLRARAVAESQQLQLAVSDKVDAVRSHVFSMQRAVQNAGVEAPASSLSARNPALQVGSLGLDKSSLHAHPGLKTNEPSFLSDLNAAATIVPIAAANHQWQGVFQWSYFYDAAEQWFLIYPLLQQVDLFKATRQSDLAAALSTFFDADGTRPVALLGPRLNPQREMIWTRAYQDASGKGLMVSLLAPVYKTDSYVGTVGTDLTLQTLRAALAGHAPSGAEAFLIDRDDTVLARSSKSLVSEAMAKTPPKLSVLYPDLAGTDMGQPGSPWLRLPVANTPWSLVVHIDGWALQSQALAGMGPFFGLAALLFLALFALAFMQNRRYIHPALQLAAYVQQLETAPDAAVPPAPRAWQPLFDLVKTSAQARETLLQQERARAAQLQERVTERTEALGSAHEELSQTRSTLRDAQRDLLTSDRLGSLGARVVGVTNDVSLSVRRSMQHLSEFAGQLSVLENALKKGLRRSDLDQFVLAARQSCQAVTQDLEEADELVQGFKQIALDRSQESSSHLRLHELVSNALAVAAPQFERRGCQLVNEIDADMDMHSLPGVLGQVLGYVLEAALARIDRYGAVSQLRVNADWGAGGGGGETILLNIHDDAAVAQTPGEPPSSSTTALERAEQLLAESMVGSLVIHPGSLGTRVQLTLKRHMA